MERIRSILLCLSLFVCFSCVQGLTYQSSQVPKDFQTVSSVNLKTTGKRTEFGEAVHSIELALPHGKQIAVHVKSKDGLVSPDCSFVLHEGNKTVRNMPCRKVEAYEGIYEDSLVFLGFLDQARTMLKGFFEHKGQVYFVDPTFEHESNLKLHNKFHLATGPMIIYSGGARFQNQTKFNGATASTIEQQRKRGIEQDTIGIGAATTRIVYPAPRFPGGQCSQRKTLLVNLFLDHSFAYRWSKPAERQSFQDPFTTWRDIDSFFALYVGAMSRYVYENSIGVNMVLNRISAHSTPESGVVWNTAGSYSGSRYYCPYTINSMLDSFTNWCQTSSECLTGKQGGLNHLISDCQRLYPGEGGTVGLAWVGIICTSSNTGTCTFLPGREGYQCSAHEIGHNFGAPHDFRSGNQDIMSYENEKYDGFSDQSFNSMCTHLSSQGYRCLQSPSPSGTGSCSPQCSGKTCGSDGCGGLCGTCKVGQTCKAEGTCVSNIPTCIPNCMGNSCGNDGCGGSCGTCSAPSTCSTTQRRCVFTPTCTSNCKDKGCGESDGCDGVCGVGCDIWSRSRGYTCDATTKFICSPPPATQPTPAPPTCKPNCEGKTCGSDGCGGTCGTCGRGSVCNTRTSTCSCVPITSCFAQNKKCGTIFDGCSNVPCGDKPCTTTCTPNKDACAGKSCGYVSNGCEMISCGGCKSTPEAQTCINNQCVRNNQCGACASDATCVNGKCACRPGFIGDGFTCTYRSTPDPTTPDAWKAQSGTLNDWTLSSDNKVWTNANPSRDPKSPSLIRWTNSQSMLAATEVTISINVLPRTSKSMGGFAIGLDGNKYVSFVVSNNQVLAHTGSSFNSGPWYVLGNYATGAFSSTWVSLSITLTQYTQSTVTLKGTANGKSFLNNCETNCIGIDITNYLQVSRPDAGGDLGLFSLADVSDFNQLRVTANTKTFVTLSSCVGIPSMDDLKKILSGAMDLDENLITQLDSPCFTRQKRSVEQVPAVVSFTTVGMTPFEASAIGPSVMASQLETGGALSSSVESLPISSVSPVQAAVANTAGTTTATVTPIAEADVVAGLGSGGLSAGAIAGIVIASIVGAALLAVLAVVVVKKMSGDSGSNEQGSAKDGHIRFSDIPLAASNPPATSNAPKGGRDILMPDHSATPGHTSLTGRAPPLQHSPN